MPVLRTYRTYRLSNGRKRFVRLYKAWHNMQERVRGVKRNGSGEATWLGLKVEWATFEEFREWAIAAGFSKLRCSLDREDTAGHYTRKNCRWLTVQQNNNRALHGDDPLEMGGRTIYSNPHSNEPPF